MYIGIDVGTTSTAAIIYDSKTSKPVCIKSEIHNAGSIQPNGHAEQSVSLHEKALKSVISKLPQDLLSQIKGIGITGQMHGVLFFNDKKQSPLYTWQDKREGTEKLQKIEGCSKLKDGFGFTTMALVDTKEYTHASTIMDYFVYRFTGEHVIDETNAASWGLFDLKKRNWDRDALKRLNIREEILPKILKSGSIAGELKNPEEFGFKTKCKVLVSIGDNQASIIGCKGKEGSVYISIGTSAQVSMVYDSLVECNVPTFEVRPFIDNKYLLVAAILCGGESFKFLKAHIINMSEMFGNKISDEDVFNKIDEEGLKELKGDNLPIIIPTFLGERWDVNTRGEMKNINLTNFTFGKISAALSIGLANHLKECIPIDYYKGKNEILGNGNSLTKSKTLQNAIEMVFQKKLVIQEGQEEAAVGSAILASKVIV